MESKQFEMEQTLIDQIHSAAVLIAELSRDPSMSCACYFKIRSQVSDLTCLLDGLALNFLDVGNTSVIYKARLYKCISALYISLYASDGEEFAVYREWKNVPQSVREWIEGRLTTSDNIALENGQEVELFR